MFKLYRLLSPFFLFAITSFIVGFYWTVIMKTPFQLNVPLGVGLMILGAIFLVADLLMKKYYKLTRKRLYILQAIILIVAVGSFYLFFVMPK